MNGLGCARQRLPVRVGRMGEHPFFMNTGIHATYPIYPCDVYSSRCLERTNCILGRRNQQNAGPASVCVWHGWSPTRAESEANLRIYTNVTVADRSRALQLQRGLLSEEYRETRETTYGSIKIFQIQRRDYADSAAAESVLTCAWELEQGTILQYALGLMQAVSD